MEQTAENITGLRVEHRAASSAEECRLVSRAEGGCGGGVVSESWEGQWQISGRTGHTDITYL